MHKLKNLYLRLRHRFLCWLIPTYASHDKLLLQVDWLKSQERRLEAELAISKEQTRQAKEEIKTNAFAMRNAIDKAAQLETANQQLRARVDHLTDNYADRLERAYGSFSNWIALGGAASRRPVYPHLPIGEKPTSDTPPVTGTMGRISPRDAANKSTKQMLESIYAKAKGDPKHDLATITEKIMTKQWVTDAAGNLRDAKTMELVEMEA